LLIKDNVSYHWQITGSEGPRSKKFGRPLNFPGGEIDVMMMMIIMRS
jgi:hypothetical protein